MMMKSETTRVGRWLIYGIIDERTNTLIYVGKTHKRREIRLSEHIERALEGACTPLHVHIREILAEGSQPSIFVIARVPPTRSWKSEERFQIAKWRNISDENLPINYPPQTAKSLAVRIDAVELLNVRDGG